MKQLFTVLFALFFISTITEAQTTIQFNENIDVEVTYAIKLGATKPIRDLAPKPTADPEKRRRVKANKKGAPNNFANRGAYEAVNKNALPKSDDAVWQRSNNSKSASTIIEPTVNIEGLSTGSAPHDPSGDVGRDYYLEAVNATNLGVYTKEGELLQTFTANTIWSPLGFSSAGDPIIMYDQEYDRWLITEFPLGNQLLVAISEDSDPLGSWTAYNFATPSFPDYPKYGIWNDTYTVTTNEQGSGTLPTYFIDRKAMLAGDDNVKIIRTTIPGINSGPGIQLATPVDWTGLIPPKDQSPIILSLGDDAWDNNIDDRVQVHTYDIDFDTETASRTTSSILLSPFDTNPCSVFTGGLFPCIPQLGGGGLDGIPEIIMYQPHYRNFGTHESIVFNFLVDPTAGDNIAGIRWVELRKPDGGNWELYQEGTYAPDDGLDRFMGATCIDKNGNIALAFAFSSETSHVGLGFTGRRYDDPLGEMTVNEYVLVEGENPINSGSRFGDYAHMTIDPTDDKTFWFVGEYAGSGNATTRVAAFSMVRDTIDVGPTKLISPVNADDLSTTEQITIEVKNFGFAEQSNFKVGYVIDNQPAVVEDFTSVLLQNETAEFTFNAPANMEEVKEYEVKLFTVLTDDSATQNDTLRLTVAKLPRYDVGVSNINGLNDDLCNSTTTNIELEITNYGTEPLTSAFINVAVNDVVQQEFLWQGDVESGAKELLPITISNLLSGDNTISAVANFPNNLVDERSGNNSYATTFNVITTGVETTFELTTDLYPTETNWTLEDENGNVIYSSEPYTGENITYTTQWCLNIDKCYTFEITDSYSDGICCLYGNGGYVATNTAGDVLFEGGEFSSQASNEFCTEFVCLLNAEIDVLPTESEEAIDGVILVTPANGLPPFEYSIDGGDTFQDEEIFTDLIFGTYQLVINDANDCSFSQDVEVTACAIEALIEITNETYLGAADGFITIAATGGNPPYEFSIDGGENYTEDNAFENLENGAYTVNVIDALGCQFTEENVALGLTTSNGAINSFGEQINVYPNPTNGVVSLEMNGYNSNDIMLNFDVLDSSGKQIQTGKLVKYNETYKGQVSLVVYPSGIYFIRFTDEGLNKLVRIVKK